MSKQQTLYAHFQQMRQVERKTSHIIMLAGYLNQQFIKSQSFDIQQFLKDSLKSFKNIRSFVFIKGIFYVHILESSHISNINQYITHYQSILDKHPALPISIRVVHQSYQNPHPYFQGHQISNQPQAGPILNETDKTQEQIQDRAFQIYDVFLSGAKKKMENPSYKVGTMIVLSNDDMSLLISNHFMSLKEYKQIYIEEMRVDRQQELDYPLPPTFFDVMEYLEISDYKTFKAK